MEWSAYNRLVENYSWLDKLLKDLNPPQSKDDFRGYLRYTVQHVIFKTPRTPPSREETPIKVKQKGKHAWREMSWRLVYQMDSEFYFSELKNISTLRRKMKELEESYGRVEFPFVVKITREGNLIEGLKNLRIEVYNP